jgi:thiol-disulfide isomerase/thioredoxin
MSKWAKRDVLVLGILSPFAAFVLYALVYGLLTRASTNLQNDWQFRLTVSTAVMFVPFLLTVGLAITRHRRHQLSRSGIVGAVLATLSLMFAAKPISDGVTRSRQEKNMAVHGVAAPLFDTTDLNGNEQRLEDQRGKVVLINMWATWCGPCRAEMPKLERLYQAKKDQGFIVYGLSDENVNIQKKFLQIVPVTYPLLTVKGNVPDFYRQIVRYPSMFLIDASGRLQPVPGPDQPFENVEAAVDALIRIAHSTRAR